MIRRALGAPYRLVRRYPATAFGLLIGLAFAVVIVTRENATRKRVERIERRIVVIERQTKDAHKRGATVCSFDHPESRACRELRRVIVRHLSASDRRKLYGHDVPHGTAKPHRPPRREPTPASPAPAPAPIIPRPTVPSPPTRPPAHSAPPPPKAHVETPPASATTPSAHVETPGASLDTPVGAVELPPVTVDAPPAHVELDPPDVTVPDVPADLP